MSLVHEATRSWKSLCERAERVSVACEMAETVVLLIIHTLKIERQKLKFLYLAESTMYTID